MEKEVKTKSTHGGAGRNQGLRPVYGDNKTMILQITIPVSEKENVVKMVKDACKHLEVLPVPKASN